MSDASAIIGQIERAVQLIAERLDEDEIASLEELARTAALSKYHFHRVYRLVTGETCSQTITRLRLARGAGTLSAKNNTITQAAMAAGYSSSQAFAKAMKRELSQSASTLREDPERLAKTIRHLSKPDMAAQPNDAPVLSIELASLDPFQIISVRTVGVYPNLHATYGHLFENSGGVENIRAIVGLSHGNSEDEASADHVFDCGLQLENLPQSTPADIQILSVKGGDFLLTRHVGAYDHLSETVDNIYRALMASANFSLVDIPCLLHYLDDPEDTPEEELRTDIYLPIVTGDSI